MYRGLYKDFFPRLALRDVGYKASILRLLKDSFKEVDKRACTYTRSLLSLVEAKREVSKALNRSYFLYVNSTVIFSPGGSFAELVGIISCNIDH